MSAYDQRNKPGAGAVEELSSPACVDTQLSPEALAARAAIALATGEQAGLAALRREVAARLERHAAPGDAAQPDPGGRLTMLDETLTAFDDAKRVLAERHRQSDARRPLRDAILAELVQGGPRSASELVATLGSHRSQVAYALGRLERDELVARDEPATPGRRLGRPYQATQAGIATVMAG